MRPDSDTLCACQWGICGACNGDMDHGRRPRHDHCLSRKHGQPIVYPLTRLCSRQGFVTGPPLWPATGASCRYICSCPCAKTGPAEVPPVRWYLDRPGNVVHTDTCTHREDARRWRRADGMTPSQLTFIMGHFCPAPCARGLSCADHGFAPTGTRRTATARPVPAADDGALFDLEVT